MYDLKYRNKMKKKISVHKKWVSELIRYTNNIKFFIYIKNINVLKQN